jgi:xanthine dehydrogenase/oxidase
MDLLPAIQSVFKRRAIEFYLNGTKIELIEPNPQWTLLDFIRSQHGLKGTKLGCGEGGCGACTVVLQTLDENPGGNGRIKHLSVNACLFPLIGGTSDSNICTFFSRLLTIFQSLESMS